MSPWATRTANADSATRSYSQNGPAIIDTLQQGVAYWGGTWSGNRDAQIANGAFALTNYGVAVVMRAGTSAGVLRRSIIYCNLNAGLRDSVNAILDSLVVELTFNAVPTGAGTLCAYILRPTWTEGAGNGDVVPGVNWTSRTDETGVANLWRNLGAQGADSTFKSNFSFTPRERFQLGIAHDDATYDIERYAVGLAIYGTSATSCRINVTLAGRAWQTHMIDNNGLLLVEAVEGTGLTAMKTGDNTVGTGPRWIAYYHLATGMPVLTRVPEE